jgi:hypothetical protein
MQERFGERPIRETAYEVINMSVVRECPKRTTQRLPDTAHASTC